MNNLWLYLESGKVVKLQTLEMTTSQLCNKGREYIGKVLLGSRVIGSRSYITENREFRLK